MKNPLVTAFYSTSYELGAALRKIADMEKQLSDIKHHCDKANIPTHYSERQPYSLAGRVAVMAELVMMNGYFQKRRIITYISLYDDLGPHAPIVAVVQRDDKRTPAAYIDITPSSLARVKRAIKQLEENRP